MPIEIIDLCVKEHDHTGGKRGERRIENPAAGLKRIGRTDFKGDASPGHILLGSDRPPAGKENVHSGSMQCLLPSRGQRECTTSQKKLFRFSCALASSVLILFSYAKISGI